VSTGRTLPRGLGRAALALLLASCGSGERTDARELRVFCAASAVDFVERAAADFEAARIVVVVGPTSGLARQIADGAPADLFVSASREWVTWLAERAQLAGAPVVLAHNRLVCATAPRSALAAASPPSLRALLDALDAGERLAIADEGVPAGQHARARLLEDQLADRARPFLVGQTDVRAVARAIQSGEASAGFVYATDTEAARLATLFALPPTDLGPIELLGVALRDGHRTELSARLLAHLQSERSRELLDELGFEQAAP
jgi:molybdate transport system substrate-binding protein